MTDGFVDLADYAAMQLAASSASRCTLGKGYAGALVDQPGGVIGAAATIDSMLTALCNPTGGDLHNTAVHVGITKVGPNGELLKWAQIGYGRGSNMPTSGPFGVPPPNPGLYYKMYIELSGVGNPADNPSAYLRLFFDPPPNPDLRYSCFMVDQASGYWTFIGGDFFDPVFGISIIAPGPTAPWAGDTGNRVDFMSEPTNVEDHVPGSLTLPCFFIDCEYTLPNGLPVPVDFGDGQLIATRPFYRAVETGPEILSVWDVRAE